MYRFIYLSISSPTPETITPIRIRAETETIDPAPLDPRLSACAEQRSDHLLVKSMPDITPIRTRAEPEPLTPTPSTLDSQQQGSDCEVERTPDITPIGNHHPHPHPKPSTPTP